MLNKCTDCGARNQSFREYCVKCGGKLTRSHRMLHLTHNARSSRFVLDHKFN